MEAVFSSGDIAKQLPQEAKRFTSIDKNFMKITQKAFEVPNCVQCCCGNEQMKTLLPWLTEQLELCQKSLTAFLDTKRAEFPRFYFVFDKTLLTILSNSSKPGEVAKNLVDCFCGLKTIFFVKDDAGNSTKESYMMQSQDGETVGFDKVKN
jgi:dynein heavy chain